MSTNEERAQMLYDKALAELNTYLENLKTKPPQEIINSAYQIVNKHHYGSGTGWRGGLKIRSDPGLWMQQRVRWHRRSAVRQACALSVLRRSDSGWSCPRKSLLRVFILL